MVIQKNSKQDLDIFDYVKHKDPDFFRQFNEHYREVNGSYPNMSKSQCLYLITQKMKKRKRTRLQGLYPELISSEELNELEQIIKSSPSLKKIVRQYADVQKNASKLNITKTETQKLEKQVAVKIYENLDEKDKREYTQKRLTILLPRLNIGPWMHLSGAQPVNGGLDNFLVRNRYIFENLEDLAQKILERHYSDRLQSERTIAGARRALQNFK